MLYKPIYIQYYTYIEMTSRLAVPSIRVRRGSSQSKRSSQESFDSVINDLTPEQSKFCTSFIENWEIFHAYVCSFQTIQSHHLFGAKFITYRIKVITDHIVFTVDKRYRDFFQLYSKVSMLYTPKTKFPKKTHLRSKVCPLLTENRRKLFDDFMSELIAMRNCNKSVIAQFITFLNIKSHYNEKQLDETIFSHSKMPQNIKGNANLFGHLLRHELVKIDTFPNQSLRYLQRVQSFLTFSNKAMVRVDDLKTLFLGINKIPGLIQFGCSTSNQVVALSFLKTIKKFMNPEICPYSQVFKKVIQMAPARFLLLQHQQILTNQQFCSIYFQLVELYLKTRSSIENQPSFEMLIRQVLRPNVIKQFVQWKTGRRNVQSQIRRKTQLLQVPDLQLSTRSELIIQSKSSSEIQDNEPYIDHQALFNEQVEKIRNGQKCQDLKQIHRSGDSYCLVCPNKKFIHYQMITTKGYHQIQQILKKWTHNKLVRSFYQAQKLTNICKLFIAQNGGGQKLFQLFQTIKQNKIIEEDCIQNCQLQQTEEREIQIMYSPPKELSNVNSFYFYAKVAQQAKGSRKVQIIYYFPMKRVRKMFKDQFTCEGNLMWESLCNSFLQKQNFSGQSDSTKTSSTV